MKKFYIPILAFLLLTSLKTQAQYNSITDGNPSNFTLDDANFWQGGLTPPNPCNNCIIKIFSSVNMVRNGLSSVPLYNCLGCNALDTFNCPGCNFLNNVVLNGSTVNLYGDATLGIYTYLRLFNSSITLGNNPVSTESIFVNDQVDLDPSSSIRLANNLTVVNANNDLGNIVIGPHNDFLKPDHSAGLYYVPGGLIGDYSFSMILNSLGYGVGINAPPPPPIPFNQNGYKLNCSVINVCATGIVYGPTITTINVDSGMIFIGSTTLPVDLVQFLALKNGDGSVKLVWATSQEVNAGYYDIERSGDQSSWTKIGSVKAVGNTSTTSNYSFVDRLPVDGTGYYRLKMVDLDGKFKYSKTITVTVENDSRPLVIYNNPFSDMIRMKVNVTRGQTLVITVSDMLGKTYINQNYHAQTGDNLINLPSSITDHGVYVMRVYGESYDQTVKLQKQ